MPWQPMLRPLPRFIAPFRDETISSYLARLAEPNRLDPIALHALLADSDRRHAPVPLARLAAITGMPARSLAYAMPQICSAQELAGLNVRDRPRAQPGRAFVACRHCSAGQPITRWALHDEIICSRHRRWISEDNQQPDLTRQPEILHAHQQHRRLIRRHGRDAVMRAVRDAEYIRIIWNRDGLPDQPGFEHRMSIFHGPDWKQREIDDQTDHAASYPRTVALARLFATSYWRQRILGNSRREHDEFIAELRRTVAPWYSWDHYPRTRRRPNTNDPLHQWRADANRRTEPPLTRHEWNQPETITTAAPIPRPDAGGIHDVASDT